MPVKEFLERIIAAKDEETAMKIVADLQRSKVVEDQTRGRTELASAACVGVACSGVVNCDGKASSCKPYACETFGGHDHTCEPVACRSVSCPTNESYA